MRGSGKTYCYGLANKITTKCVRTIVKWKSQVPSYLLTFMFDQMRIFKIKMGQSRPLFVIFRLFNTAQNNWDSNLGRQDGRRRRIHWAMAAPHNEKLFERVKIFLKIQCGNYGIGGHYWTHPDYHHPSPEHWMNPKSVGNRVATILTILDAPKAGSKLAFKSWVILS